MEWVVWKVYILGSQWDSEVAMQRDEAIKLVQDGLKEEIDVNPDRYALNTELVALKLDSLSLVKLIMWFETKLSVEINEPNLHALTTVGNVVDLVEKL